MEFTAHTGSAPQPSASSSRESHRARLIGPDRNPASTTRDRPNGKVSTNPGTEADHGNAVTPQPDGKILVAGGTADPKQGDNILVIRYNG